MPGTKPKTSPEKTNQHTRDVDSVSKLVYLGAIYTTKKMKYFIIFTQLSKTYYVRLTYNFHVKRKYMYVSNIIHIRIKNKSNGQYNK